MGSRPPPFAPMISTGTPNRPAPTLPLLVLVGLLGCGGATSPVAENGGPAPASISPEQASAARAAMRRGIEALQARNSDRAAVELREAVRLDPSLDRAQFALGKVLVYLADVVVGTPTRDLGVLEEAIAALDIAVAAAPRDPARQYWRARALRDRGRQEEAVEGYRATLRLDPGHAEAQRELAFLLADMGEPDAAQAAQRALELQPEDATLWFLLGMEREAEDDVTGAREAYERAIAMDWTVPSPYSKLAVMLARGEQTESSAAVRRAYEAWYDYGPRLRERILGANEHPDDPDALVALAEMQFLGQRFDLARDTLERALRLRPEDTTLRGYLASTEEAARRGPLRSEEGTILPLSEPREPFHLDPPPEASSR